MNIKLNNLLFAALAGIALASCSSDDFLGAGNTSNSDASSTILFSGVRKNLTRGDATGSAAAELLSNEFRVYGTETRNGIKTVDFDNYRVVYEDKQEGDSTNVAGWSYFGKTSLGSNPAVQSVKYWNMNASEYDFVAFSGLADSIRIADDASNSFYVDADNMGKIFVSDRVTAKYAASATGTTKNAQYGKDPVTLNFKRLTARVRLGVYETVPGYAVMNMRFYYDDNYLAQAGTSTKTVAGLRGKFPVAGTYNITYDENNLVQASYDEASTANNFQFGELEYYTAASNLLAGGNMMSDGSVTDGGEKVFLGTASSNASFARKDAVLDGKTVENSDWQVILPYVENTTNLVLRADFDLVPLDGSKTIINVKGASAVVPVKYALWKPNFAYTYIFKITDKISGTTGDPNPNPEDPDNPNPDPNPGADPSALYPITFDANVSSVEDYNQETITGMTNLGGDAITTYSATSDVTNPEDEYAVGETVIASSVTSGEWKVAYTSTEITEKQVDDNNTYSYTSLGGGAADGKTINENGVNTVSFKVEKAGYYIVWLRYLPTGSTDIESNYVNTFKVVKTHE